MPGDERFCAEMITQAYPFAARTHCLLHRLKLCTFGGQLRQTGKRNMASGVYETGACARRLKFLE